VLQIGHGPGAVKMRRSGETLGRQNVEPHLDHSAIPLELDEVAHALDSAEAGAAATRGGFLRVGSYVLNTALGALGGAFLYRHLGTKDTGTYVTAVTVAGIVAALSDLGLTALGLRELSTRDTAGRARLMRSLLGLRVVLILSGTALSLLFAVLVGYKGLLVAGIALAGASLLPAGYSGTLALSLVSRLRFGLIAATETARQAVTTALTIALVAFGAGTLAFIGMPIPVGILLLMIIAWLVPREVPLLPRVDRAEWGALAREVLPFALAGIIAVIYFRLSVVVVSLTASATQISYFGLSFRILEMLILIPGIMVTGAFPIFARSALHDHERLAYGVSRVFMVSMIVGIWFTLALAIGAPIAIKVIGGSAFSKAASVLRIQAFGLGGSFVSSLWGMVMISLRLYRQLVLVSVASLVGGIVLVTLLASAHGADGAALGTTITEVAAAAFIPIVIARSHPSVVPSVRQVPRVAFAAGLAALVLLIPGLPVIAQAALATVVYATAIFALRVVPEELLIELRRPFAAARKAT
jgi:O-antigen/teichoic acid export membrane protein